MAVESNVVVDVEPELDFVAENRTTSELISRLKYCFRDADFAKVESILTTREIKLKQELETTEKANEWLKEKLEFSGMEKIRVENELKKYERECWKLQQLNRQLSQEKSEREAMGDKEIDVWKRKYEGLQPRILKLEADLKSLSNVEPFVRVSIENGKDVAVKNASVGTDVVEENVDLARADMNQTGEDSKRSPSRSIIQIIDSDDERALGDILSRNEMTSQKVANSDRSSQTGAQLGTGMRKRKQDSCPNVSENKNGTNDGFEDEDVYDNAQTVDCKIAKVQKLIHEHDGSSFNHCSKIAASRSNSVENFCTPSSREPGILRQCEEKMEAKHVSPRKEFNFDVAGICDIDDSSSSSSSSSDSDDDVDMDFDFSRLTRNRNDKMWESEKDMLASFDKDNELYLKAVCALYRQQTVLGKLPGSLSSSTNCGFNLVNAPRVTSLAEFLVDGDPLRRLKKSVSELLQHNPKGLDDCKKIAIDHSKQLFEIYQEKEDTQFMS